MIRRVTAEPTRRCGSALERLRADYLPDHHEITGRAIVERNKVAQPSEQIDLDSIVTAPAPRIPLESRGIH